MEIKNCIFCGRKLPVSAQECFCSMSNSARAINSLRRAKHAGGFLPWNTLSLVQLFSEYVFTPVQVVLETALITWRMQGFVGTLHDMVRRCCWRLFKCPNYTLYSGYSEIAGQALSRI